MFLCKTLLISVSGLRWTNLVDTQSESEHPNRYSMHVLQAYLLNMFSWTTNVFLILATFPWLCQFGTGHHGSMWAPRKRVRSKRRSNHVTWRINCHQREKTVERSLSNSVFLEGKKTRFCSRDKALRNPVHVVHKWKQNHKENFYANYIAELNRIFVLFCVFLLLFLFQFLLRSNIIKNGIWKHLSAVFLIIRYTNSKNRLKFHKVRLK